MWGSIGGRGTIADRDRPGGEGGGRTGFYGSNRDSTSTVTECPAKGLDSRLGEPSCMPPDREDTPAAITKATEQPRITWLFDVLSLVASRLLW